MKRRRMMIIWRMMKERALSEDVVARNVESRSRDQYMRYVFLNFAVSLTQTM